MTLGDRPPAAWARVSDRGRRWLPMGLLLAALGTVFLSAAQRDYFYKQDLHAGFTGKNMALAANLGTQGGLLFLSKRHGPDGGVDYQLYNRFPVGAVALTKLAILPFPGDFSAQLAAARALMLAFFCGAAVLAYLGLARLVGSRAVALGAVLLAFSSYHLLDYSDVVCSEMSADLFAVMLVFHGMVLFEVEGGRRRFWELAARVCVALLLGWHVYGLLLPFLAFGAARAAAAAWVEGRGAGRKAFPKRLGAAAGAALFGRSALLGAVALLFGCGVLGWNLAQEHAAFDGQRAVAELPSVRSMLKRTGLGGTSAGVPEEMEWRTFLRWQFHRAGAATVPFAFSRVVDLAESVWRASGKFWLFGAGVVATFGAFAGLALFPGPRAPPAALALAGFCWAYLASGSTAWAQHQFETLFHIGVPLCLFAAVLLGARRFWPPAPRFCAVAAIVVFAASSVAMGLRYRSDDKAREQRGQMAEFAAIATMIQGKSVWVADPRPAFGGGLTKNRFLVDFFTAGSLVHYSETPLLPGVDESRAFDFLLAFERRDVPALLTPDHRDIFLYQAGGGLEALREARLEDYRRVQTFAPAARGVWDIHILPDDWRGGDSGGHGKWSDGEIAYLKAPCKIEDTTGRFFLHLTPVDANLPVSARVAFERRDHLFFQRHGVLIDDKCLLRLPLPTWPIANVSTGQFHPPPERPIEGALAVRPVSVGGGRFHPGGEEIRWRAAFELETPATGH